MFRIKQTGLIIMNKNSAKKPYILIAEDDIYYAHIYEIKLKKEGYDVSVFENGKLAFQAAKKKKPNLVLLDLLMPIQDGFQTAKQLKEDYSLNSIPILVLTNLGQEEDIQKMKEFNIADYIIKTNSSIGEIMTIIKKHCPLTT